MSKQGRSRARTVLTAGALVALSQSAAWGQTYNGNSGGGGNANWSTAANWGAGGQPAAGGGAGLVITMGPLAGGAPAAHAQTNQDHGNPFNLNTLLFPANAGRSFRISGGALRFNGNASIQNNTNDESHFIDSNIILNGNLIVAGTANMVNLVTQLFLEGVISEQGGARSVTVNFPNTADVVLGGANTFTGGVSLTAGQLVLGHNQALGNGGTFAINGPNVLVRARFGNTIAFGNNMNVGSNVIFGDTGASGSLNATGTTTFVGAQIRNVTLRGGVNHSIRLSGPVVSQAGGGMNIVGDTAPTFDRGRIRNTVASPRAQNVGSLITLSGNSPNFAGTINLTSATMRMNGVLGAANARIANNFTVGDGTTRAAWTGTGTIFFNRPGNQNFTVRKNASFEPGNSPGIFTIDGGDVVFEGGSTFGIDIDGPSAGNGSGFHSQLSMVDGTVSLLSGLGGERPYLSVAVLAESYIPQVGDMFTIIHQVGSQYARIDLGGGVFSDLDGASLFNGATFMADGFTFRIRYDFDADSGNPLLSGNDVMLEVVAIPAPGGLAVVGLGALALGRRRRR